jgi:gamma-glutamyltranspeptidase / glutathione hydrolase
VASRLPRPLLRGPRGVVACGHPLAASVGVATFRDGGGAVDAALAAAASLAVLMPDACGLGGDAFMLVRSGDGVVTAINGSGAAGSGVDPSRATEGPGSVAVPGFVAALDDAQALFARMPRERLLEPAVSLAGGGFPVGGSLLGSIANRREALERGAPGWALLDTGLRPGSLVRLPALAGLLQRIGRQGRDAFYGGHMGRAIERAVGGSLLAEDLAAHTTVVRAPVRGSYRGHEVTVQPPVSQALLAPMALAALERSGASEPADRAHVAVEAIEAAFQHKHEIAADGVEETLLATELDVDRERAARRGGPTNGLHTTSVTAADSDGVVVSMLISVYALFGSSVLVPEGGFLLNDRLAGCSTDPASPNYPAPRRRPVHTLSPALVTGGGQTFALATPGADGQVQTLVQLIDAIATEGERINRALDRPRWRSSDAQLFIEDDYDAGVAEELERRGHELVRVPVGAGTLFGIAVAAGVDEAGTPFAASDSRGAWAAAG